MRNILSIVVGLLFTFISCGTNSDEVVISKEEYSKLKGEAIVTKRTITFPEGSGAGFDDWEIIQASDGHDYLDNGGGNDQILMHYIECNKCKKK